MLEALGTIGMVFVIMTFAAVFLKGYTLVDTLIMGYTAFCIIFFLIAEMPGNGLVCGLMAIAIWTTRKIVWVYQDKRSATVERVT